MMALPPANAALNGHFRPRIQGDFHVMGIKGNRTSYRWLHATGAPSYQRQWDSSGSAKNERTRPGEDRKGPFHKRVCDQALPMILNMPVPHVGHVPFMALRPLAMVTSAAFFMSRFALHFTQYASTAIGVRILGFALPEEDERVEREAKVIGTIGNPAWIH
jgi:hypothetical protein